MLGTRTLWRWCQQAYPCLQLHPIQMVALGSRAPLACCARRAGRARVACRAIERLCSRHACSRYCSRMHAPPLRASGTCGAGGAGWRPARAHAHAWCVCVYACMRVCVCMCVCMHAEICVHHVCKCVPLRLNYFKSLRQQMRQRRTFLPRDGQAQADSGRQWLRGLGADAGPKP